MKNKTKHFALQNYGEALLRSYRGWDRGWLPSMCWLLFKIQSQHLPLWKSQGYSASWVCSFLSKLDLNVTQASTVIMRCAMLWTVSIYWKFKIKLARILLGYPYLSTVCWHLSIKGHQEWKCLPNTITKRKYSGILILPTLQGNENWKITYK